MRREHSAGRAKRRKTALRPPRSFDRLRIFNKLRIFNMIPPSFENYGGTGRVKRLKAGKKSPILRSLILTWQWFGQQLVET